MSLRFYGVYRASVESNIDPLLCGRVQVRVPEVFGDGRLAWAEPCHGYAGDQVGGFALPPVGASGWVQFERGDPDFPVLLGCMWQKGQSPAPGLPEVKMFATDAITVTFSDVPGAGGVTLEVGPPAVPVALKLSLGASGIELSTGSSSIVLDGVKVSLNNGALDVT